MSQKTARRAARSAVNGALGSVLASRGPVGVGRGAVSRSLGTLGTPATVGGLGDASRPRGGFGKALGSPRTARATAVGALGASGVGGTPSKLRPRPGRGSNGVLALAATPYYTALDRIRTR